MVIKAANEFTDKTTTINQMWQTDFTYSKIIGWGWCYLSTILDDYSSYIIKQRVIKVKRCERSSDLEVWGHSLRARPAQDLLIRGYDLAAMRAGGWPDTSTVSRYLQFSQHNILGVSYPRH